jgi:adenosyl cobinamide kinase/adenosyl cobinamide phosphate guanylyltransferase
VGELVITLVLGGTRSGKSQVAERIASGLEPPVTFVATATVTDDDMRARVELHRTRRPDDWRTVECDTDLPTALRQLEGTVLVDSLGTWVASRHDRRVDASDLVDALVERSGSTVVVSEEVGLSVHPTTEAGRRFADALGDVNLAVAACADDVFLVVAGRRVRLPDADA